MPKTTSTPAAPTLAYLQYQYTRLHTATEDGLFHQSANTILNTIHAVLSTDPLSPDLIAAYRELERLTRACVMQHEMWPSRPLC